ncbi:MAG TPA: hypothetical protein VGP72_13855 [Planctomycetota bacterium]
MNMACKLADEDDLERCRRVRAEIDSRFASIDEMFDFFAKLDRERRRRGRAASKKVRLRKKTLVKGPRKSATRK